MTERSQQLLRSALARIQSRAWPSWVRVTAPVAVLMLVLVIGHASVLVGEVERLASARQREAQLRQAFETGMAELAKLSAYRHRPQDLDRALAALLDRLPEDADAAGLVEDITQAAAGSALTVRGIALKPERDTEFYVELPAELTVQGGYHQIGAFASRLAALPRMVTLHDFTLEAGGTGDRLAMSVLARAYRSHPRQEVPN